MIGDGKATSTSTIYNLSGKRIDTRKTVHIGFREGEEVSAIQGALLMADGWQLVEPLAGELPRQIWRLYANHPAYKRDVIEVREYNLPEPKTVIE